MIRHVVLWNVRPDAGPEAGQWILDELNRIKDEPVPAVSSTLGADAAPASEESGSRWQYGLVCDYEGQDHFHSYYSASEHADVVDEIVPLIASRAVCDFEL